MDYSQLSPEKKAKIDAINAEYKQRMRDINRQALKDYGRITAGGIMQGLSMLPVFNVPYVGTGLGGALFEAGQGVIEGKKAADIARQAGKGFAIGETVGAIPYAGKAIGRTKVGAAVGDSIGRQVGKLADTQVGRNVINALDPEFAPVQKFTNPWYVDEGLQNGEKGLKYIYDAIKKNNGKLAEESTTTSTKDVIRNIRMEGAGHNGGIGVYTKRSYPDANAGVVATYYPTKNLKHNAQIKNWETPKFNELTPNNDETAQLYYDTLKGVKDQFGKAYDTVSLHPVEEYKNMRLFLSPDKTNGFAIQPDGDIVSVFGAKPGSGTSHSMLELALQNKGTKLDNYDVSRLRNLYENHGFEVTERLPWDDAYWNPQEWDKAFMQKTYGIAEPDITYRQINNTDIYPEIQKTGLFERLIDALN